MAVDAAQPLNVPHLPGRGLHLRVRGMSSPRILRWRWPRRRPNGRSAASWRSRPPSRCCALSTHSEFTIRSRLVGRRAPRATSSSLRASRRRGNPSSPAPRPRGRAGRPNATGPFRRLVMASPGRGPGSTPTITRLKEPPCISDQGGLDRPSGSSLAMTFLPAQPLPLASVVSTSSTFSGSGS